MTEINLDKYLASTKPGQTHKLKRAVYTTIGYGTYPDQKPLGEKWKPGSKVFGEPYGGTIIKNIRPDSDGDCTTLRGSEGCLAKDLVIDCGEKPNNNKFKHNGIYFGKDSEVFNCTVENTYGNYKDKRESFGIVVCDESRQLASGRIVNSKVTKIQGDYTSGIIGHFINQCHVERDYPVSDMTPIFMVAYNIGQTIGGMLFESSCKNMNSAVYADTGESNGNIVQDNNFYNTRYGMRLNAQTTLTPQAPTIIKNILFRGNIVILQGGGKIIAGVELDHTTADSQVRENIQNCISNICIQDNKFEVVRYGYDVSPPKYSYAMNCASFTPSAKRSLSLGISGIEWRQQKNIPADFLYRNRQGNAEILTNYLIKWITKY